MSIRKLGLAGWSMATAILVLALTGCGGGSSGGGTSGSGSTGGGATGGTGGGTTTGCSAYSVPWSPSIILGYSSSGSATVYFTPAYNGGSAITGYTVTSSGGQSASGTASPITVGGLTNGTTYTFTVTATNCLGTSKPSTMGGLVIPGSAAGAPTGVTALAGDTQALVSFTPPTNSGGYSIIGYSVISNPGNVVVYEAVSPTNPATPILVSGLTNGTSYTFTVFAVSAAGAGTPSLPSNAITPIAVPDRPTGVTATAGNTTATVNFVAPANQGGSAITGYTVTSNPSGGVDTNTGTTGLSHAITGLTNGTAYTFTVTATNSIGTGLPSIPSTSVIPAAGNMLYVDAVNGLDTNSGTAAAPFKSITKGLAAAKLTGVATTVNVAPGVYSPAGYYEGNQSEVFPLTLSSNVALVGDVVSRGNNATTPTQINDYNGTATAYTLASGTIMPGSANAAVVIPAGVTGATVRGFFIEASTSDNFEVVVDKASATLDSNYTYAPTATNMSAIADVAIFNASNVTLTNNYFDDHEPGTFNSQLQILDSAIVVARNNVFAYSSNGENGINIGNSLGTSTCTVDLGTSASPGGNSIVPYLGVGVYINGAPNTVQASGNTWLPNIQGSSATGTYPVGTAATANYNGGTYPSHLNYAFGTGASMQF